MLPWSRAERSDPAARFRGGNRGRIETMRKLFALVQIIVVLALVGFSTVELFRGNLPAAMSTFPLLLVFYLFVAAGRKGRR